MSFADIPTGPPGPSWIIPAVRLAERIFGGERGEARTRAEQRAGPNAPTVRVFTPRGTATFPNRLFVGAAPTPTVGAGPSPADVPRYVPGTAPVDRRFSIYRQLARRSALLATGYNLYAMLLARAVNARTRAAKRLAKRVRGARGLRWVFQNGRWWQIGRGVLRGGAASVILTGVLNLPSPVPTQRPAVRVRQASGRYGPWRYQDPRTGKYTATAPGSGGRGVPAARGRAAAPTALPGGAPASTSSSRTSGAVLKEVRVTARRVPVPVPSATPTKVQQLLKLAPTLLPLLLPSKSKDRAKAIATVTGLGQPMSQVVPQAFPLTAVGSQGVGSNGCPPGCRPEPKKRKPRTPRKVCYQGTYTETASGLRKTKRRKVPCR